MSRDINCSADEVAGYIDRFNFSIDTRGTSDEKAIKGAFLTAVGKDAFSLLRTLVYPKTLRDASIAETQTFCDTSDQPNLNWLNGRSFIYWFEALMKLCANFWFAYNSKHLSAISRSTKTSPYETDWWPESTGRSCKEGFFLRKILHFKN